MSTKIVKVNRVGRPEKWTKVRCETFRASAVKQHKNLNKMCKSSHVKYPIVYLAFKRHGLPLIKKTEWAKTTEVKVTEVKA